MESLNGDDGEKDGYGPESRRPAGHGYVAAVTYSKKEWLSDDVRNRLCLINESPNHTNTL